MKFAKVLLFLLPILCMFGQVGKSEELTDFKIYKISRELKAFERLLSSLDREAVIIDLMYGAQKVRNQERQFVYEEDGKGAMEYIRDFLSYIFHFKRYLQEVADGLDEFDDYIDTLVEHANCDTRVCEILDEAASLIKTVNIHRGSIRSTIDDINKLEALSKQYRRGWIDDKEALRQFERIMDPFNKYNDDHLTAWLEDDSNILKL